MEEGFIGRAETALWSFIGVALVYSCGIEELLLKRILWVCEFGFNIWRYRITDSKYLYSFINI